MHTHRRWLWLGLAIVAPVLVLSWLAFTTPLGAVLGLAPGGGRMPGVFSGMMGGMHGRMMGALGTPTGGSDGAVLADDGSLPEGVVPVEMRQMRFAPDRLTIKAGTAVVITNRDPYPHRIVQAALKSLGSEPPGFLSPVLQGGQRWTYTFNTPGTYPILCDVGGHHLTGMVGEIVVTE